MADQQNDLEGEEARTDLEGPLQNADAEGHAGGRRAGPFVHFWARLDGTSLGELRFETFGCHAAEDCGELLCIELRGKTIREAVEWNRVRLLEALGGLPRSKEFCADLAIDALGDLVVNLARKISASS